MTEQNANVKTNYQFQNTFRHSCSRIKQDRSQRIFYINSLFLL